MVGLMPLDLLERAEWDAAYINDLPHSAFACIDAGGEKDGGDQIIARIDDDVLERQRHRPNCFLPIDIQRTALIPASSPRKHSRVLSLPVTRAWYEDNRRRCG